MHQPVRRPTKLAGTILHILAAFALIAQIAVVLSPLAEGRDGVGMAAHVESGGNPSHHAHDPATCIACQVGTFYGAAGRGVVTAINARLRAVAPVAEADVFASIAFVAHTLPRAPPA